MTQKDQSRITQGSNRHNKHLTHYALQYGIFRTVQLCNSKMHEGCRQFQDEDKGIVDASESTEHSSPHHDFLASEKAHLW